jgi:hypothetical protein
MTIEKAKKAFTDFQIKRMAEAIADTSEQIPDIKATIRATLTPPVPEAVREAVARCELYIGQTYSGRCSLKDAIQVLIQAAQQPQSEGVTEDEALRKFAAVGLIPSNAYLLFEAITKAFPNGLKIVKQKGE